ncbi:MAG: hypothetical protein LC721_12390 [Actinobacteria bacterium]|nr:hypothetical protein [Actinomycetota bacterium]
MVSEPARATSLDQILLRHGLRGDKARLLDTLDRSLEESLPRHRVAAPSTKRAALLARGGFTAAGESAVRLVATQRASDYAALVETALVTADVAELVGVSDSRIRQLTADRRLVALPGKPRRYPAWQFTDHGLVPNLELVLPDADPGLDQVSLWRFFVSPDPDLALDGVSVSPRDWLVAGADPGRVQALLRDL